MKPRDIGWRVVFVAGFPPAIAGMTMLALGLWSATFGTDSAWISLMGQHSFSAAALERGGKDLHALWLLTVHLCGVNLAMSGITISTLAWLGLRDRKPWAFTFLWILVLWVGVNDVVALLRYHFEIGSGFPFALIPLTLGSTGLIIAKREMKRSGADASGKAAGIGQI